MLPFKSEQSLSLVVWDSKYFFTNPKIELFSPNFCYGGNRLLDCIKILPLVDPTKYVVSNQS
ncbi:MAG: hypothetical protein ACYCSG_02935, partial [Thermoplasmataceae archaeon]